MFRMLIALALVALLCCGCASFCLYYKKSTVTPVFATPGGQVVAVQPQAGMPEIVTAFIKGVPLSDASLKQAVDWLGRNGYAFKYESESGWFVIRAGNE